MKYLALSLAVLPLLASCDAYIDEPNGPRVYDAPRMQYESPQVHGQYEQRYRPSSRVIVQGQANNDRNVVVTRPAQTMPAPAPQRVVVQSNVAPAPAPSAIVNAPPQARANEDRPAVVASEPSTTQAQSGIRVHD